MALVALSSIASENNHISQGDQNINVIPSSELDNKVIIDLRSSVQETKKQYKSSYQLMLKMKKSVVFEKEILHGIE